MTTTTQVRLPLEHPEPAGKWRLDGPTREAGRLGLAQARAELAEAGRRAARREAEALRQAA
jgi:hypothetical protein